MVNWVMEYKKKLNESKFRRGECELIRTEENQQGSGSRRKVTMESLKAQRKMDKQI